ncbi:RNA helicase, partial [Ceratobasidium sp. 423]
IEEPAEHDSSNLAIYYDEGAAVRGAILGSLESEARGYTEEALDPRDAWLALEKKYLTTEAETDTKLISIDIYIGQRLADLRLEGGDVIEHIAEFCRMRCHLNGTRFALDGQASVSMLYRSLPPSLRQSVLTPERTEMKDFNALCARLSDLSQSPEPQVDTYPVSVEDHTNWGVPEDVMAFGLTGGKNPLLEERAAVTRRDCLLKGHRAGTPECPQYEWRKELWGTERNEASSERISHANAYAGGGSSAERPMPVNTKRLGYEFSEPVKVVLDFDELGLKPNLKQNIPRGSSVPSFLSPMVATYLAQAPPNNGKTTVLVTSILQRIDTELPHVQVLVFTSKGEAFQNTVSSLGSNLSIRCASKIFDGDNPSSVTGINNHHIFVGTPDYLLGLIRRDMLNMSKLTEEGMEEPIFEACRHVPPLAQVVVSSTVYPLSVARAVTSLLASPLQIWVNRNEGRSIGTHFYVKVSATQKLNLSPSSYYDSRYNATFSSVALVITDTALPTTGLANIGTPLINYDVPGNVEDYIKRLN